MAGHGVCAIISTPVEAADVLPTVRFTCFHDAIHWTGPTGEEDVRTMILHCTKSAVTYSSYEY
jgi:hypothetical protein